jgi:hypothetical protein
MMTKKDKIDCLMLISALEAFCIAKSSSGSCPDYLPDYLLESTSDLMAKLKADILEGEK